MVENIQNATDDEHLQYSTDALNVLNKFFRVDLLIYVEGDDDVVFWDGIFSKLTSINVEFSPLGSSSTLDKYIERIRDGSLDAVAARDSDYLVLTNKTYQHPRIMYTYGYSIENTLLNADTIYEICRVCIRGRHVTKQRCEQWLNEFSEALKELVVLDLANEIAGTGIEVLGNNCSRYMLNQNSDEVKSANVMARIADVSAGIKVESKNTAISILPNDNESILRWLRGHLLTSGIQKFISNRLKEHGRKDNLSFELLFTNAMHQFFSSFTDSQAQFNHYHGAIKSLEKSL